MGDLYIGAPHSQNFSNIVFDTGSNLLAVMSRNCKDCEGSAGYDEFISMASKTDGTVAN